MGTLNFDHYWEYEKIVEKIFIISHYGLQLYIHIEQGFIYNLHIVYTFILQFTITQWKKKQKSSSYNKHEYIVHLKECRKQTKQHG